MRLQILQEIRNSVLIIFVLFIISCNKYNYNNIFDVSHVTGKKMTYINGVDGFFCEMSKQEFDSFKGKSKFKQWNSMKAGDCFYSKGVSIESDYWGILDSEAEYSVNRNSKLEGEWPVVIYYPRSGRLLCIIAEMALLVNGDDEGIKSH